MDCLGFLITFDFLSKLHSLLITVLKVIFRCLDSYFYRIMYTMKCNITFCRLIRNCNHMEIINGLCVSKGKLADWFPYACHTRHQKVP